MNYWDNVIEYAIRNGGDYDRAKESANRDTYSVNNYNACADTFR